jgi:putative transposase
VLGVSTSGYYYWLEHPIGLRERKEQELLFHIDKIYQQRKCRYGSPSMTVELPEHGIRVSRPRVARLRQKTGIRSIIRQQYRVQTTDSNHGYPVAEKHLNRDFSAERLAQKGVSNLTYIKTGEGWLYLTAVLDLADRKVVGWALSDTMAVEVTSVAAWRMAIQHRPVNQPLLFHSDRGAGVGLPSVQKSAKRHAGAAAYE